MWPLLLSLSEWTAFCEPLHDMRRAGTGDVRVRCHLPLSTWSNVVSVVEHVSDGVLLARPRKDEVEPDSAPSLRVVLQARNFASISAQ